MIWRAGFAVLILVGPVYGANTYQAPPIINPDTLDMASMNDLFDFIFGVLKNSPDISAFVDPFLLNKKVEVKQIGFTLYEVEVVGLSNMMRITPAVLFYDGRNLTFSSTIAAGLLQLCVDYKVPLSSRTNLCGHLQRAEALISITVPFTGKGGSPYVRSLEVTKLVDWRLTSGQSLFRLVGNTRLTEIEFLTAIASTAKDAVNNLFKNITLPDIRKHKHQEL